MVEDRQLIRSVIVTTLLTVALAWWWKGLARDIVPRFTQDRYQWKLK